MANAMLHVLYALVCACALSGEGGSAAVAPRQLGGAAAPRQLGVLPPKARRARSSSGSGYWDDTYGSGSGSGNDDDDEVTAAPTTAKATTATPAPTTAAALPTTVPTVPTAPPTTEAPTTTTVTTTPAPSGGRTQLVANRVVDPETGSGRCVNDLPLWKYSKRYTLSAPKSKVFHCRKLCEETKHCTAYGFAVRKLKGVATCRIYTGPVRSAKGTGFQCKVVDLAATYFAAPMAGMSKTQTVQSYKVETSLKILGLATKVYLDTVNDCAWQCLKNSKCVAFQWNDKVKQCGLKKETAAQGDLSTGESWERAYAFYNKHTSA